MGQWVCQGAQQPVNQSGIGPERGAGGGESGELLPLWVWGEELDMELKRAKPHGHHGFSLPPHPTRSTLESAAAAHLHLRISGQSRVASSHPQPCNKEVLSHSVPA